MSFRTGSGSPDCLANALETLRRSMMALLPPAKTRCVQSSRVRRKGCERQRTILRMLFALCLSFVFTFT